MKYFDKQLIKFLIVGIANTIVGCGVMFLLYNLAGASYWIASACNYVVGGILSFILNKYFTFKNNQKSYVQILIFIINLIICYFLAYFCAKKAVYAILSATSVTLRDNISMAAGMCLYTVLNYFGQRIFVFKYDINTKTQNNLNETEVIE